METTTTGYLYGIMYNDTLMVLTFSVSAYDENESTIDYTALQLNLPADIYFCGILQFGECKEEINPDVFKVIIKMSLIFDFLLLIIIKINIPQNILICSFYCEKSIK